VRMTDGWNQIYQVQGRTFKLAVLNILTSIVIMIIVIIIIASSISGFTVT
jgi:hypothetical protein